ncbi:hydroxyisourate hydrolase [Roseomonas sp. 18066]|uniref:hydroxyisourate hydrolase n=1 Tax=Roseomonas sp. 18066 TaxID=2681412 RepID=UPI00135B896B|nr:hydroxyisourate hydrolase [Roseomonas sp. 18066]
MSPPGALSTHVLNTAEGRPAQGVAIELWRLAPTPHRVAASVTDKDGRPDAPLLPAADFRPGRYELRFAMGDYFAGRGIGPAERFLDVVTVSIGLAEGQGHYHVPLLCSPFSYTTYRGS